jgi:hypothetical protein
LTWGNNRFIAIIGTSSDNMLTSHDGILWTKIPATSSPAVFKSVTYGADRFMALGSQGGQSITRLSQDGINWMNYPALAPFERSSGTKDEPFTAQSIHFGGGIFFALNPGELFSSLDGITWREPFFERNHSGPSLNGMAWGNSLFVVVGSGQILTSPDSYAWTRHAFTNRVFYSIAWDGGLFVTVGTLGETYSSADGFNWTLRPSGTTASLRAIAGANGRFVAVGDSGIILTTR